MPTERTVSFAMLAVKLVAGLGMTILKYDKIYEMESYGSESWMHKWSELQPKSLLTTTYPPQALFFLLFSRKLEALYLGLYINIGPSNCSRTRHLEHKVFVHV